MQILQVVTPIEWVHKTCEPFIRMLDEAIDLPETPAIAASFLPALYEHSSLREILLTNQAAVAVLAAFALNEAFLHPELMLKVVSAESSRSSDAVVGNEVRSQIYQSFIGPWRRMVSLAKPLRELTIPPILSGDAREEILTINISDREHLDVKTITKTLSQIEALYETVERVRRADPTILRWRL